MTDLSLRKTPIDAAKIQGYERNGYHLTTQAMPEFSRFEAIGLSDNQTAVFSPEFDFTAHWMTCKFTSTQGNIVLTLRKDGVDIWTQTYNGATVAAGVQLPAFPIHQEGLEIRVTTTKSIDFLWISVAQCSIVETISAKQII